MSRLSIAVSGGPKRQRFQILGENYGQDELVDYLQMLFPRLNIHKRATKETTLLLIPDDAPRASDSKLNASSDNVQTVKIGKFLDDLDRVNRVAPAKKTTTKKKTSVKAKKRTAPPKKKKKSTRSAAKRRTRKA